MDDKNYLRSIALRIRANIDESRLPSKGVDELFDMYAVLALSKGAAVTNEDVHDAWSAWATKYDSSNASLVPFSELSEDVQKDDSRFTDAIRSVAESLS